MVQITPDPRKIWMAINGLQSGVTGLQSDVADLQSGVADFGSRVFKQDDQVINTDDSLNNDDELFFPITSTGVWMFSGKIFFATTATADLKYDFSMPATSGGELVTYSLAPSAVAFVCAMYTSFAPLGPATVLGGTGNGFIGIEARINFTATGTVQFRWCQNTSDPGDIRVVGGSYLTYGAL
jgi:hypothetical protein